MSSLHHFCLVIINQEFILEVCVDKELIKKKFAMFVSLLHTTFESLFLSEQERLLEVTHKWARVFWQLGNGSSSTYRKGWSQRMRGIR